jgi:hypothetical protein
VRQLEKFIVVSWPDEDGLRMTAPTELAAEMVVVVSMVLLLGRLSSDASNFGDLAHC